MGQHRRKVTGLLKFVLPDKCDPVFKGHGLTGECRACDVVSATRHPSLCVMVENVPGNGHFLPSDHLQDVQPQTLASNGTSFKVPQSLQWMWTMPLTSKQAGSDPKPPALKAVGIKKKKPKQICFGERVVSRGHFELISDLFLSPQLGENTPLWRNCT